jgi:hypothetical protein
MAVVSVGGFVYAPGTGRGITGNLPEMSGLHRIL